MSSNKTVKKAVLKLQLKGWVIYEGRDETISTVFGKRKIDVDINGKPYLKMKNTTPLPNYDGIQRKKYVIFISLKLYKNESCTPTFRTIDHTPLNTIFEYLKQKKNEQ